MVDGKAVRVLLVTDLQPAACGPLWSDPTLLIKSHLPPSPWHLVLIVHDIPPCAKVFNEELEGIPKGDERVEAIMLGKMRCLAALSEWRKLFTECRRMWRTESRPYDEEGATIQQVWVPLEGEPGT